MRTKKGWLTALIVGIVLCVGIAYVWLARKTVAPAPAGSQATALPSHPAAAPGHQANRLASYGNARFEYTIDYPTPLLTAGNEADNGDGVIFKPEQGDADIRVWGSYNVDDDAPAKILKDALADDCAGDKASYAVARSNLVAYSCLDAKGRIVYRKTLIDGSHLVTVHFVYRPQEQALWAPVIKQMGDAIRIGG